MLSLFMALMASLPGYAYTFSLYTDTVYTFTGKVLFPKASAVVSPDFSDNSRHIDSIRSFLSSSDTGNLLSVKVIGSYSPEGKYAFNTKLATARALAMADIVKGFNPALTPAISIKHPHGGYDYSRQRFAELQIVWQSKTEDTVADTLSPAKEDTAVSESRAESATTQFTPENNTTPVTEPDGGHLVAATAGTPLGRLFLTTNMLYDAALIPNIGVGMSVTDRITLTADWMCAWWNNRDKRRYWRLYGGDIEARYRIGKGIGRSPLGGHHVGVYCSMACYDFQTGRSHKGTLSDKYNYAVGMSYTYSMPVATRLNIDFSLGIGYLWGTYKKHRVIDDCDVWLSTHKLGWFGPTRAGVSLVWLIGNSITNKRKGGDR